MPTPIQFSVITAVCDGERTLGKTIQSVAEQRGVTFEHIVVDNGSTDGTASVVRAEGGTQARYLRLERRNRSLARNTGIATARGKYVLFLDADDWLLPDALAAHAANFEENPAIGMSVSDGWFCDDSGEKLFRISDRRPDVGSASFLATLVETSATIGAPLCVAAETARIREAGVRFHEELTIGEDWLFWTDAAAHMDARFIANEVCMYRWHAANTTLSAAEGFRREQLADVRRRMSSSTYFGGLPESTRRHFYYEFLFTDLRENRAQQEVVIQSVEFRRLSAAVQAELLRLLSSEWLASGVGTAVGRQLLRQALQLNPVDWKARVLLALSAIHPDLALAAVRQRRRTARGTGQDPLPARPAVERAV